MELFSQSYCLHLHNSFIQIVIKALYLSITFLACICLVRFLFLLLFPLTLLFTFLCLSVFVPFVCPVFHWLAFVLAFASWSHLPLAKILKNTAPQVKAVTVKFSLVPQRQIEPLS